MLEFIPDVKTLKYTARKFLLKSREYSKLKNWEKAYEYLEKSYQLYTNQVEKSEDFEGKFYLQILFHKGFYILGKNCFFNGELTLATKCFNYMQEQAPDYLGWREERFPREIDIFNTTELRVSDLGNPFIYLSAINVMTNKIEEAISNLRSIKTYYESDAVPLSIIMSLLKGEHFYEALDIVFEFEKNLEEKCLIRKYLQSIKELYAQLDKDVIDKEKLSDFINSNRIYISNEENLIKAILGEKLEYVIKEVRLALKNKKEKVTFQSLPIPIKLNEVISRIDETKKRPDYWLNLHNVVIKRLYDLFSETDVDSLLSDKLTKSGAIILDIDRDTKKGITHYKKCGGISFLSHLSWEINNRLQEKIAEIKYQKEWEIRLDERNKVIADLSHSLKNIIATVADPLENLRQTKEYVDLTIEKALRGANLVREITNAMNYSLKGSIADFYHDAEHNQGHDAQTLAGMVNASLRNSVSNMFDTKYFSTFSKNYFPDRDSFFLSKNDWTNLGADAETARIANFIEKYLTKIEIELNEVGNLAIGNDKGSAVKLLTIIQEMILNAIKYTAFVECEKRFIRIKFFGNKKYLTLSVKNKFKPQVKAKTTGMGQVILKNFAEMLNTTLEIDTANEIYSAKFKMPNFWKGSKT